MRTSCPGDLRRVALLGGGASLALARRGLAASLSGALQERDSQIYLNMKDIRIWFERNRVDHRKTHCRRNHRQRLGYTYLAGAGALAGARALARRGLAASLSGALSRAGALAGARALARRGLAALGALAGARALALTTLAVLQYYKKRDVQSKSKISKIDARCVRNGRKGEKRANGFTMRMQTTIQQ